MMSKSSFPSLLIISWIKSKFGADERRVLPLEAQIHPASLMLAAHLWPTGLFPCPKNAMPQPSTGACMWPQGAAQKPTDSGRCLDSDSATSPDPKAETSNTACAHTALLHRMLSHAVLGRSFHANTGTRTWSSKRKKKLK